MINLSSLVLRLGLGVMFMAHGAQKAFGLFSGPGVDGFSKMLSGLGFAPALFWAYVAAYVELMGGLFLIIGLAVRTSSLLLVLLMIVATLKVHLAKGFFLSGGGFEYNFIILSVLLALIIQGSGRLGVSTKF
ncbi:MAG: DoxX family protein [Candidatus Omnitrophica bacterium]|nr:DoxX family protein [Candidatus Omnitrophota bacterium]